LFESIRYNLEKGAFILTATINRNRFPVFSRGVLGHPRVIRALNALRGPAARALSAKAASHAKRWGDRIEDGDERRSEALESQRGYLMLTRREFLVDAATGVAATAFEPAALAATSDRPLGVQLYTVRSLVQTDFPGALAAIRKIGYRNVETYVAEYKMSAKDLRQAILDAGLTVPSAHFGYDDFESKLEYGKELGSEYVVCSSIPMTIANSADGYKRGADQYNAWGAQAKAMGLKFGFHNHNAEFQDFGGVTGFDVLMKHTDPALVQWQMDCYWVAQAGRDPVSMLRQYGHRMQTLHLKDRKPNVPTSVEPGPASAHFTEIGAGTLDWVAILRLAEQFHLPYMFVEQDTTEIPPLESLQISYTNLVKFLNA
jgi:sugar phosphate isomerase/epimerase